MVGLFPQAVKMRCCAISEIGNTWSFAVVLEQAAETRWTDRDPAVVRALTRAWAGPQGPRQRIVAGAWVKIIFGLNGWGSRL